MTGNANGHGEELNSRCQHAQLTYVGTGCGNHKERVKGRWHDVWFTNMSQLHFMAPARSTRHGIAVDVDDFFLCACTCLPTPLH